MKTGCKGFIDSYFSSWLLAGGAFFRTTSLTVSCQTDFDIVLFEFQGKGVTMILHHLKT